MDVDGLIVPLSFSILIVVADDFVVVVVVMRCLLPSSHKYSETIGEKNKCDLRSIIGRAHKTKN